MTAVAPRAASATTGTARASPFAISAGTTTATNSASTAIRTIVPHTARGSPASGVIQATAQQLCYSTLETGASDLQPVDEPGDYDRGRAEGRQRDDRHREGVTIRDQRRHDDRDQQREHGDPDDRAPYGPGLAGFRGHSGNSATALLLDLGDRSFRSAASRRARRL